MNHLLSSLLSYGGPVILLLIALSVLALALTLHKITLFSLQRVGQHRAAELAVERWLTSGQRSALASLETDPSPVSLVVTHAMRGRLAGAPDDQIKEDVGRVASERLHQLRRHMRTLDMIGQIAPLLGLFGTILGMIDTFAALQDAGTTVDPSRLAGGIWVALLTTAAGLSIAMPVSVAVSWFEGRIEHERIGMEAMLSGFFAARITEPGLGSGDGPQDATRFGSGTAPGAGPGDNPGVGEIATPSASKAQGRGRGSE